MKAVILAAGKGTRMKDLTAETPKPLLKVLGKSLLEWKLENLPDAVKEIILVIGYQGEKIKEHLGTRYNRLPITYVEQEELLGTGHALWQIKDVINTGKLLVLMGDDLYGKRDLDKMLIHNRAMLVQKTATPMKGGLMFIENEKITGISEGGEPVDGYMYTGACLIDHEIFNQPLAQVSPGSKEFGLPQTIVAQLNTHPVQATEAEFWIRITAPEDLQEAERQLS
jgi:UDP-N-acetylglucosamine diphosphorylase / glucose-1-phosphate thymidylyltransferase / UDP-N-acetylgalactosamine diphosphorylase / glucosamine-1-phosphate N-acetyltransferase / galactosamine-1-phosphate N-acetyltransferase